MEQTTSIKHRITGLLESAIAKKGIVLYVLQHYAGMYEVRLHLPEARMDAWNRPQHIKFKVAAGKYRDYTPAIWDDHTKSCSIYVDTAHDGPGSEWARKLQPGDHVVYLGMDSYGRPPADCSTHIFLGDPSAIGHFLALMQLINGIGNITGTIIVGNPQYRSDFAQAFPSLSISTLCSTTEAQALIADHAQKGDKQFYLAGNSHMVHTLRKMLKQEGVAAHQVQAQGFWK